MKKLLAVLMLLPCIVHAQKNEIGLSTGIAPSFFNRYTYDLHTATELWLTTRLTYNRNFNNTQIGVILEGSALEWDDGGVVAALVMNKKFPVGRSYLYVGGSAGFYYAQNISKWHWVDRNERGYTLGLQAGMSLRLSDHFAFITEVGFRNTQVWFENYHRVSGFDSRGVEKVEWLRYMDSRFSIVLPTTMGIRYRF